MEVRRPSAREELGRDRWRYAVLAALVGGGFARFGVPGGLGLLAVAGLTIGAVGLHARRARLRAQPGRIARRRLAGWRSARLGPGARLVRVLPPGPAAGGSAEARAMCVVLDADGRRRLRWTGRWEAPPEEIAAAASIPFEDRLGDTAGRDLLPWHLRHPVIVGVGAAAVIVAVVALAAAFFLRERDRARDRDAAAMDAALTAHAAREDWDATAIEVERQGSGAYSGSPDEGVIVVVVVGDGRPEGELRGICLDSLRILRGAPLEVREVTVGRDRFHGVHCDPRGFFFD